MAMIVVYVLIGIVLLVFVAFFFKFFSLWFRALLSGAHISMIRLIGMWIRKVKLKVIVDSRIMVTNSFIFIDSDHLETHYLAGGDVIRVSKALVAANKAAIPLTFQKAAAIDLAGRDVLDAVKTSVNPKLIDCR